MQKIFLPFSVNDRDIAANSRNLNAAQTQRFDHKLLAGTVQRSGGSCRFGKGHICIADPVKPMTNSSTERAVVDRATNLEQQISTLS